MRKVGEGRANYQERAMFILLIGLRTNLHRLSHLGKGRHNNVLKLHARIL